MVYKIYTILDRLAEEAGPIFVAVNDAVAKRQYEHVMKDILDRHEYVLVYVGEFDTVKMLLQDVVKQPVFIFDPLEMKEVSVETA